MKVRIGNDFVFLWSIERNGKPENLNECLEIKLTLKAFGMEKEIDFEIVDDNIIRIEVTPEMTTVVGIYSLVLKYTLADESFSDNDRKCAVDTKAFTIVANTAGADDISEIAVTSDILIGLRGDAFTYDDFTEEQIEDLKRPAIEGGEYAREQGDIAKQIGINASLAEADRVINENLRIQNETERINIFNSIKNDAVSVIESANNSASNANEKANFAQAQGDYAKTQGDRLEELSNNWIKNW